MSSLVLIATLFSFFSGLDFPFFRDSVEDQLDHIETCMDGGCQR